MVIRHQKTPVEFTDVNRDGLTHCLTVTLNIGLFCASDSAFTDHCVRL